jgi:hypothetical protein
MHNQWWCNCLITCPETSKKRKILVLVWKNELDNYVQRVNNPPTHPPNQPTNQQHWFGILGFEYLLGSVVSQSPWLLSSPGGTVRCGGRPLWSKKERVFLIINIGNNFSHIFLETHERDPIGDIRYLLHTHTHTKKKRERERERERESLCAGNYRGLRKG